MSYRKKLNPNASDPKQNVSFSNWLAQLLGMTMPASLYLVSGRGSSKTTEFQVERLIEMVYDMPGAPVCWVSDTYSNLQKNVLPMILEGLERKGFMDGVHYLIEKGPANYTEQEKSDLPEWLRDSFWKPFNKIVSYKHTLLFFTGLNVTFASLDRPSSLAGKSYVHVFGDEVKYFPEAKVANLLKAVRGYRVKYGNSPFYRGVTFTTDMPNTANIGEHDWILKQAKNMDKNALGLLIRTACVVNECRQEWLSAKKSGDIKTIQSKLKTLNRWEDRLYSLRCHPCSRTFFYIASSYVNVDILTPEWFSDAFAADLGDVKTAILSIRPRLEGGNRFYANLGESNFYRDGNDDFYAERFGLRDVEDSRILKYLIKDRLLDVSIDFGNMMSLLVGQECGDDYRILKELFTLSPEWIRELADKFIRYFAHHEHKYVNMYYDRAGNNYSEAKADLATTLKKAIEMDGAGRSTGWHITLMSVGQSTIAQNEEYIFMQTALGGYEKRLPGVLIDACNCKLLKLSLEGAKTRIISKSGLVGKDKRSEKLPIDRLPYESTNFSDSFKYLLMRKKWRELARGRKSVVSDISFR